MIQLLKISHPYFYQLQAQMFCANLIRTDLVVWFGDNEPLFIESIFFYENFWTSKALYLGWIIFIVVLPFQNFLQEGLNLETNCTNMVDGSTIQENKFTYFCFKNVFFFKTTNY